MQNRAFSLFELASEFRLRLKGNSINIEGVASLKDAASVHLGYIKNKKFLKEAIDSDAGAFVVNDEIANEISRPVLIAEDPYFSFINIKKKFIEPKKIQKNDNLVYIHETATIGDLVEIGPFCYIGANVKIAQGVKLHTGVKLLDGVLIEECTEIFPGVTVFDGCKIGKNCVIGANSVIGGDGFGFHFAKGVHHKVPQSGIVVIKDNVEIGSQVSIDRATFGETFIDDGCKIDNQVQIAHNVKLGKHVIVVAQSGISGSTEIGDYVVLAGKSGLVGHIKIGKGVTVGGASVVTKSVQDGKFVVGYPAVEERIWKKQAIYISKLPEIYKRIKDIERKIDNIYKNSGD